MYSRDLRKLLFELNSGQFVSYLRGLHPEFAFEQLNKVQGQPFIVKEIVDAVNAL